MSNKQTKPKEQVEEQTNFDNKNVLITIFHEESNMKKKILCNKDKKLSYCIDKFCKKVRNNNEDSFFTEFDFFLQNGNNQKLDPTKTIKENNITYGSKIKAQDKPKNPKRISLKIKDFENRKIPSEIERNRKIKENLKQVCDSLSIDVNNTLFLSNDRKIDIDKKVKDLDYLKNDEIITIAQKNPIFTILIENVPYGTQEIELIAFLKDYDPKHCEIFMSDQQAKDIPGYATLSFQSQSNATFAIAKCSKEKFKNHKMAASIQNF